jgi:hypothetical protein
MKAFNAKWLPYLAAGFQAFQFSFAGSIYFGRPGWLIGAIGGIVVNLSVAIAASRISDIAKTRRPLAWTALAALMTLSPIAVGTAGYLAMPVIPIQWLRIATAVVWAVIPDASILLTGAVTGKSLVRDEKPASGPRATAQRSAETRSAKSSGRSATRSSRSAKSERSLSAIPCRYAGAGCDRTGTQNAMNAHARNCKFKPTISMPAESILEGKQP